MFPFVCTEPSTLGWLSNGGWTKWHSHNCSRMWKVLGNCVLLVPTSIGYLTLNSGNRRNQVVDASLSSAVLDRRVFHYYAWCQVCRKGKPFIVPPKNCIYIFLLIKLYSIKSTCTKAINSGISLRYWNQFNWFNFFSHRPSTSQHFSHIWF